MAIGEPILRRIGRSKLPCPEINFEEAFEIGSVIGSNGPPVKAFGLLAPQERGNERPH